MGDFDSPRIGSNPVPSANFDLEKFFVLRYNIIMNIFMLDEHPYTAAQMHCDKHVVKMILETAQMLSTVSRWNNYEHENLYKKSFEHHPCTKWVGAGLKNFYWTVDLFNALSTEYTYRYNKIHLTTTKLYDFFNSISPDLPNIWTQPALAMPEQYKTDDPIESYREYYINEKSYMARWDKGRPAPKWYIEAIAYDA